MSLLIDALKKAEESKRQLSEGRSSGGSSSVNAPLELLPTSTSSRSPLPDLSLHGDADEANWSATSTKASMRPKAASYRPPSQETEQHEASERDAVRNVFSAKQTPKSKIELWLMLGLSGIIVLTIGGYFGWQWLSVSTSAKTRSASPHSPSQAVLSSAASSTPLLPAASPKLAAPPVAEIQMPFVPTPLIRESVPSRTPKTSPAASQAAESPLWLQTRQPKTDVLLNRAYDALLAGQFNVAQQNYEQVLQADSHNIDALLGMATLATHQGQNDSAQSFYLQALNSDPKEANAQAGLINAQGRNDPVQSESRLKTSLASQPDSPALHFALGNLYASQSRWRDAQHAFFLAYSNDPANPDYPFNLAVSLDHLHQNELASQYYLMALNAATISRLFSFNTQQVRNRLLELQP